MATTTLQTIKIPADLAARIEALSLEDKNQFAVAAITDAVREQERRLRGLAEGQKLLTGPAKPLEQCFADLQAKQGGPDLSQLTREELEEFGRKAIAEMDTALQTEFFEQEHK